MRVDIWSDVVCPFCYIGKKRLESAAEQAGVELEVYWHSYELDPEAPVKHEQSNTERLAQKYGRTVEEMEEMQQKLLLWPQKKELNLTGNRPTQVTPLMLTVLSIWPRVKV